jgi:hypothetical protein
MKVIRDNKRKVFILVPVENEEQKTFAKLVSAMNKGDVFEYGGREDDGRHCKIFLHFGAKTKNRVKRDGCVTVRDSVLTGGVRVVVQGTNDDDKSEVGGLRDVCYFGGCSPIFMGPVKVQEEAGIAITLKLCKHCQAPMIGLVECEWSVCDACAKKCQHEYEKGIVHGGPAGTGAIGQFCGKCGRGKPNSVDTKKSDAEHKVAIEEELGISWIYTDTILTPRQIATQERVARMATAN